MTPQPPLLFIRPTRSFWVVARPLSECTVTASAFEDGVYDDASCYDGSGGIWPVLGATYVHPPTWTQRLVPWRMYPVEVRLGPRRQGEPAEVVAALAAVFAGDNGFGDDATMTAEEFIRRLETAQTPTDVIRIAADYA